MIRIIAGKKGKNLGQIETGSPKERLEQGELLWVDIVGPTTGELDYLKQDFGVHPLTIQDAVSDFHLPKIEQYDEYLFIIWQVLNDNPKTNKIENSQISFMLSDKYLITIHKEKNKILDDLFEKTKTDDCFYENGSDWAMRSILDLSAEGYYPIVDNINDQVDDIEDNVFANAKQSQLKELFTIKRKLLDIRKVVAPQRDAVSELVRFERFVKPQNIAYFRDIFDRMVRIIDLVDTARDIISGTMDIYLSAVSNRLNEVMKRLTVLATIFGTLTVITGVYGMNFKYMPELNQRYGYFTALGAMVVLGTAMYLYMKKKYD